MSVQSDFVDRLLSLVNHVRSDSDSIDQDRESSEPFPKDIIMHWLNFAVYYERAAVSFIGEWMRTIEEDDALHYFSRQLRDEAKHYRMLKKHLIELGGNFDLFNAPSEWTFLMDDYYPNLSTLVERLAAHNIAAETGALGFLEYGFHKFPENIRATVAEVIKDEKYHVAFGSKLLRKYCRTDEQKQLAETAMLESLQHMQRAREVFVNTY